MKKRILCIIIIAGLTIANSCNEKITDLPIDPNDPVAVVGDDQFISVGSYFSLDGSKSSKGNGSQLIYKWYQDPLNPQQFNFTNYQGPRWVQAAIKEGTYNFSLTVNNGIKDSKPANFVVKISSRVNSVIKDTVLEANIRYSIGKQSGELTEYDFQSITKLQTQGIVISSSKIKKLDGIEHCIKLKELKSPLHSITNLSPLSNLTSLEQLEIDQNWDLSDVTPLANLTTLKYLEISRNSITDINSLSTLRNLISLKIAGTPQYHVTDLSAIRNMTSLKEFVCSFTPSPDLLVFSGLQDLEFFYCSYSKIKDLSGLKNCTKLIGIYVTVNEISDLTPVSNLKELKQIWVDGNKVEDISPLKNLEKLQSVILDNNLIKDIKPLVENVGLGSNTTIMLRGNQLNEKSINEYIPQLKARGVIVIL